MVKRAKRNEAAKVFRDDSGFEIAVPIDKSELERLVAKELEKHPEMTLEQAKRLAVSDMFIIALGGQPSPR